MLSQCWLCPEWLIRGGIDPCGMSLLSLKGQTAQTQAMGHELKTQGAVIMCVVCVSWRAGLLNYVYVQMSMWSFTWQCCHNICWLINYEMNQTWGDSKKKMLARVNFKASKKPFCYIVRVRALQTPDHISHKPRCSSFNFSKFSAMQRLLLFIWIILLSHKVFFGHLRV